MKTIVILFVILFISFIALGFADEDKAKQYKEYEDNLKEYAEACMNETGIDSKTLQENAEKIKEEFKYFYECILKKFGILTEDGDIDWEVACAKTPFISQEECNKIRDKCKDITGTGCIKALNFMKCIQDVKDISP